MRDADMQSIVMGFLYHLSIEDKAKSLFTYTGAVSLLRDYLLQVDRLRDTPELIALAVNLTQNTRNAEILCENGGLEKIVDKALSLHDDLLFKVIRNISQGSLAVKKQFKPYLSRLLDLLRTDINSNVLVEVLGTLGNLAVPELEFDHLVHEHQLIEYLASAIRTDLVDDDILLEVVVFLGALATKNTTPLIVQTPLVPALLALITERKNDDEFVLQIAFTFHKLLLFPETRQMFIAEPKGVPYLVDLLFDVNEQVRKIAGKAIDAVMDFEEEWALRIRDLKFARYNSGWLSRMQREGFLIETETDMVGMEGNGTADYSDDDGYADINEAFDY
jgi:hypothetical protein